jgi:hypothetical protein
MHSSCNDSDLWCCTLCGAERDNPVCLSVCLHTSLAPRWFTASYLCLYVTRVIISSKYEVDLKVAVYVSRSVQTAVGTPVIFQELGFRSVRVLVRLCVQGKEVRISYFKTTFLSAVSHACDVSRTLPSQTKPKHCAPLTVHNKSGFDFRTQRCLC